MNTTHSIHLEQAILRNANFTNREIEVLKAMADGLTDVEIGQRLYLSHYTIQGYRKQLFLKLDARNSCHLIYMVCRMGLI